MNNNFFQLESLPNEILIDIFQFFHPRHLFQSLYTLNTRFNILIQSLNHLTLTLSTNHYNEDDFLPYIRILIINRAIDINLHPFIQVRCLILRYPTDKLLAQLNLNILPQLEHLSINSMHISVLNRIPTLCDKIFSNGFSKLKSCYLFEWETITKGQGWTILPSLNILKVGNIDLFVYKAILSSCPNLYFLQLATLISNNTPFHILPHRNLKRMTIRTTALVQPWNDEDIDSCLSYVPNLEYLCVHKTNMFFKRRYDWLASIIACRLPSLRQFKFYFHIFDAMESDIEIEENFKIAHPKHYQSRFIINRAQLF